jgi:hypothetical protein
MDFRKKLTARLVDQGFLLGCSPKEFGTWVQTTLTRLLSLPAETFVVDGEGLNYQEETTVSLPSCALAAGANVSTVCA